MPGFSFPSAFGMSISVSIVRVAGSSEPAMRAIVPLVPLPGTERVRDLHRLADRQLVDERPAAR